MSLYVCFKGSHMKPMCFHMLFKGSFKGQWISAFHLRSLRTHLIAAALPVAPYWFFIPLTETSAVVDSTLMLQPHQGLPGPTRHYPGRRRRRRMRMTTLDHTLDHICFWQPTLGHTLDHICFWQPTHTGPHTGSHMLLAAPLKIKKRNFTL